MHKLDNLPFDIGSKYGIDKELMKALVPNEVIAMQKEFHHDCRFEYDLLMLIAKRNEIKAATDNKAILKAERAEKVKNAGNQLMQKGMINHISKDNKSIYVTKKKGQVTNNSSSNFFSAAAGALASCEDGEEPTSSDGPDDADDSCDDDDDDDEETSRKKRKIGPNIGTEEQEANEILGVIEFLRKDAIADKKEKEVARLREEQDRRDRDVERRANTAFMASLVDTMKSIQSSVNSSSK